jgi:hypothetical protein
MGEAVGNVTGKAVGQKLSDRQGENNSADPAAMEESGTTLSPPTLKKEGPTFKTTSAVTRGVEALNDMVQQSYADPSGPFERVQDEQTEPKRVGKGKRKPRFSKEQVQETADTTPKKVQKHDCDEKTDKKKRKDSLIDKLAEQDAIIDRFTTKKEKEAKREKKLVETEPPYGGGEGLAKRVSRFNKLQKRGDVTKSSGGSAFNLNTSPGRAVPLKGGTDVFRVASASSDRLKQIKEEKEKEQKGE